MLFQLFNDKLIEDDRDPFFSLEYMDYQISFYAPKLSFYLQLIVIMILQIGISCILCSIIYYGIVCTNKKRPKQISSIQGLLIGFGFIIPFILLFPKHIIMIFDIRSKYMRMCLLTLPATISFTCFEAMFGFTNSSTSKSIIDYILAESFIVRPELNNNNNNKTKTTTYNGEDDDGEHMKANSNRYWKSLKLYIICFLILSLVDSWLSTVNYTPFMTLRPSNETFITFDVAQLYNTFLQAFVISLVLLYGFCGLAGIVSFMTGKQYNEYGSKNPMFCSTSPSDFWGKRWNNIVHNRLKQGIYKPIRWYSNNNKTIAYFITFIISGILHEYVFIMLFLIKTKEEEKLVLEGKNCSTCYYNDYDDFFSSSSSKFGKQILFFGWNGILLIFENYGLGKNRFVLFLKRFLPHYIICHFVILLSLPVGHLITGDLVQSNYYKHLGLSFFRIQIIQI